MIETNKFCETLIEKNLNCFVGVPDSLLSAFSAYLEDNVSAGNCVTTANEGNAIAVAAGHYLATGKSAVVYMQNSGIGNAVNPLLSLADEKVYSIPMLLLIGWRGEPGVPDEPQHKKQGEQTLPLLDALQIQYQILDENYQEQIAWCVQTMQETLKPVALVVRKGTFTKYAAVPPEPQYSLSREEAIETVLDNIGDAVVVSTTGKTSRELFELRESRGESHKRDFLTVGSMGHTSSIALGIAMSSQKKVFCLDGDGSFLMHMGAAATAAQYAEGNFQYIIINNGAHESVGGQKTIGFQIDMLKILEGCGFEKVLLAEEKDEIEHGLQLMNNATTPCVMVLYVNQGSRENLGRPTATPSENKLLFMKELHE